jgi:hypothetical protein
MTTRVRSPARKGRSPGRQDQQSTARLEAMIEEATVDAYGESEQRAGFYTMMEDGLALPFET